MKDKERSAAAENDEAGRSIYQKPVLTEYGDVRTVTLEGSAIFQFEDPFQEGSRRDAEETRGGRSGA